MARSAGAYAQLVGRDAGYAQLRLGSGEVRMVLDGCMATVGAVSNPDNMNETSARPAARHMGWRPHVRGVAMNPVDHPHGGGEGKTSGGRHPVTPWGKKTRAEDPQEQVDGRSSSVPPREEGSLKMPVPSWKGPFVDGYLLKKADAVSRRAART
jgi:ribosomal protein L2